jgi:hypothetical protein
MSTAKEFYDFGWKPDPRRIWYSDHDYWFAFAEAYAQSQMPHTGSTIADLEAVVERAFNPQMKHQSRIPVTAPEAERFLWHAIGHIASCIRTLQQILSDHQRG